MVSESVLTVGNRAGPVHPWGVAETAEHVIVVGPGVVDAGADGPLARARLFHLPVRNIERFDLAHVRGDLSDDQLQVLAQRLLVEPVGQWCVIDSIVGAADHVALVKGDAHHLVIETGLRPGVTDREGAELVRSANELGLPVEAATMATRWLVDADLDDTQIGELARRVLHNDVIERWALDSLPAAFTDASAQAPVTDTVAIRGLDDAGLADVNRRRRLGLDPEEMIVIRDHFVTLDRDPTDAELETLAQTWSEHCAHKTFRGLIHLDSGEVIDSLMKTYLRSATDTIDAPWVRSAFVDNAGIVAFEEGWDVAIKAETHNHPSAIEPFGGANTGVGGVVRDILGVSAKPIAVTDILCFGPQDTDPDTLPDGVLHPLRIRAGVIAGVGDYGNKIGVPNIAGAIVHDPSYTTTPLVFAGCLGLLPHGSNPTNAQPGDSIVVLGGAVGRDGVGGATFSSQTMGVETAAVAGSSVQIGDPIVEKGLIDVIVAARDAGLYTAVTDCGAGGLSSAVGEMAEVLGARVDLADVPRKYPGLAPWEVWLSEAQERMVVATADPAPILALAERWGVGAATIGMFTGEGRLVVVDGDEPVIDIDCAFLHDGRPQRSMQAIAVDTSRPERRPLPGDADPTALLLGLLAHPSIRSNESVIRTYDHEVLGGTLVRPYGGPQGDGPSDGTVMVPPGTSGTRGVVLGIGVNAVLGRLDPEAMAWSVIDEAVRNAVVAGADPDELSLLDNFGWGNPTDPATLGGLVAACRGCHDAAIAFGAPFVSGKDSLYNVYVPEGGEPDPVAPTLVITAMGLVRNLDVVPLTGVVEPGDQIWLVGPDAGSLGGSHLDQVIGADLGGAVPAIDPTAVERHHALASAIAGGLVRSAHDLAEGGLAVAAAEWAFAGRLGVSLDDIDAASPEVLFGEGPGRYLVEVRADDAAVFGKLVPSARVIGQVTAEPAVTIGSLRWSLARDRAGLRPRPARRYRVEPTRERTMTASKPRVLIPVALGTNRDHDLALAFEAAGAEATSVPLTALRSGEVSLSDFQMLGVPGGFSYGDALGAGRLLGLDLAGWFADQLAAAVERAMPIIGICNGFQALVSAGVLPGDDAKAVLTENHSQVFECRWVTLQPGEGSNSVWTSGLTEPLRCPVAHGEGRFVADDLAALEAGGQVALRYANADGTLAGTDYPANPNGSAGGVAGISDASGLVLGLMPHPEDHILRRHDPLRGRSGGEAGRCLPLFAAGVAAVKQ